jgi:plastocyanin
MCFTSGMHTYIITGLIILLAGGAVAYLQFHPDAYEEQQRGVVLENGLTQLGGGVLGEGVEAAVVIHRTPTGYEPNEVTITQGDTVSFTNESSEFHWPASDVHPTHTIYSDFDPREPVAPGETWSFTFTESGTWQFHDHLRANRRGVITVEPVN